VHVSLQSDHLHLIVEADDKAGLSRGMQSFSISASKRINAELERGTAKVFAFRYHAVAITTPQEARDAIAQVLNNWRQHGADTGASTRLDPFASGWSFPGWSGPRDDEPAREPLPVVLPLSRLLREGWQRAGTIRTGEVPPPDPKP
jgi:hypothetical protein